MFKLDQAFLMEFKVNWLLLAVAFSCLFFGMSAGAFSLPFVFPEVIREFGWTREQATLLATAKYSTTAVSALVVGRLLDFVGVWKTLIAMMVLSGLALLSYLWISDISMYYLTGLALGVASGGGIVSIKVLVSKTFHASQGTAMGIAMLGTSVGATVVPIVITALIEALGWRQAFATLSLAIWMITLPLLIAGYIKIGLKKSEAAEAAVKATIPSADQDYAPRIIDLLGQRNFWVIAVVVFGAGAIDTAFIQHQVLIFHDLQLSTSLVAFAVSMIGLIGVACRVIAGNILDSTSNRGLAGFYVAMAVSCVAALLLSNPAVLVLFVVLRAAVHASVLLDTTVMSKHAFGSSRNMGMLLGIFTAFSSAGFAVGPWVMGRMFDANGSYALVYAIFAAASLLLAAVALLIRPTFWLKINGKA